MKTFILVCAIAGLLCRQTVAQTANSWISQGTSDLASHDLTDANYCFAQAVAASPTNEPANAYFAATRLLVLASQPAGSNFLTSLGFPLAGRNLYDWTSTAPKDRNGLVLAPAGVTADNFTAQARTNILPVISAAITNLALITDTNFTLNLAGNDTSFGSVTVDYGDLKLIQSALFGVEYFIYTLHAQNLNIQLTALRSLYTNNDLTLGQMLAGYPQLLTFATTNDLQNASATLINSVNAYFVASDFIRSRPAGNVRLFNYDKVSASEEVDFRLTLQDLRDSLLAGPQFLSLRPDVTVDMAAEFNTPASWRSLLPKFEGNAIELGSFPDLTFGGLLDGISQGAVEGGLGKYFKMLPVGSAPQFLAGNAVSLTFSTLAGHYYVLEASTNLASWELETNFTAADVTSTLVDARLPGLIKRFYRLRDDTGFLAFAGVVLNQNTGLPVAHATVYSVWDGTTTVTGTNGQFYLATSLPSSYFEDELEFSAPGFDTVDNYFGADGLLLGLEIGLIQVPANDNFANRTGLTGSSVSTTGNNAGATVESGEPYDAYSTPASSHDDGYGYKSVWFSWTAPGSGSYVITVSNASFYYPILAIYTGTQLSNLVQLSNSLGSGYYASHTFTAVAGQPYQIEVDDFYGGGGAYNLSIAP